MIKKRLLRTGLVVITACTVGLMAFKLKPQHTTVFLAGDSTMADKALKAYPETGWGMPFKYFFDSTVTVSNIAKNGRSSRTFIEEGLWQSIIDKLQPGDYVLIQFGHNDEVPTKKAATTDAQFHDYLIRYVTETRAKQALPVLITPVARCSFKDGKVQGTHNVYSEIVRKAAAEQQVPLIDLDRESQALLESLGQQSSKLLFNYLQPGEHPNYPNGKEDGTHFNELGARKMAQIVLADIRKLNLELAKHIVNGANAATVAPAAR